MPDLYMLVRPDHSYLTTAPVDEFAARDSGEPPVMFRSEDEAEAAFAAWVAAVPERQLGGTDARPVLVTLDWGGAVPETAEPEPAPEPAPEPTPEPAPEPAPAALTLRRVALEGGETVIAEGPAADAAAKVHFTMGAYSRTEGVAPHYLFGDRKDTPNAGTIDGPVQAVAVDADGATLGTATL